jgi:hypothetical protein
LLTIRGGIFGNAIIAKSKPPPFGTGDMTIQDFEYRNRREVVAAEIGVDSAAQSDAKGAL